jgi:tetratricopeptide (TPR) repeat protein
MKKYDEAINIFNKRIQMCDDSNSVKSQYYIGNCLYLSAKHDSAIIVFKEYLTKDLNSIPARISMYNSFNAMKKGDAGKQYLTEAYQIYSKSILENPNNAITKKEGESVLDALCRINLESKEFASVIKYAKEWSDINKNSATPYVYLGFAYQSQNDSQNACKNYNEALKLDPSNVAASKNKKALLCK